MLSLGSSLPQLRKFLRDPNGLVWTDVMLVSYWQRALIEVAQKTGVCMVAEARPWPPRYDYAVTYDWEKALVEGYQWECFPYWEANEMAITQGWEASFNSDNPESETTGYKITQPWESCYADTEQIIPLKVGGKHLKTVFAAYDEQIVTPITVNALGQLDPWYRKRVGLPLNFYWWDETEMTIGLYPRPTPVYAETADEQIYDDDGGIVNFEDSSLETSDEGIVLDAVDTADAVFLVYQLYSSPSDDLYEEVDYPAYLKHYIECAVLEYAFSADTDGFVPSLRDYWSERKKIGLEVVKKLKGASVRGRLITRGASSGHQRLKDSRLPSNYYDLGER